MSNVRYKVVNGTSYHIQTNEKLIEVLEYCMRNNVRIVVDYGNVETKESWNETYDIKGRLGRSGGNIKVPILLYNKRSIGGSAILDHCILSIKESKGGRVLYSV